MTSNILVPNPYNIFILSEAGKPIYSNCQNEEQYASLFALMLALVKTCEEDNKDILHTIQANGLYIIFTLQTKIIFCVVSKFPFNLTHQIQLVYYQIISLLTSSAIERIFTEEPNLDIRIYLKGIDKNIDSYVKSWTHNPTFFLSGMTLLPMPYMDRQILVNAINESVDWTSKDLHVAFVFLFAQNKIVASFETKDFSLSANDVNIVLNLIECNPGLKHVETWLPICLPSINPKGFFHTYLAYPWEGTDACFAVICQTKDYFEEARALKSKFVDIINGSKRLINILGYIKSPEEFMLPSPSHDFLWHFIYRSTQTSYITYSVPKVPYNTAEELKNINYLYHRIHDYLRIKKKPSFLFNTTSKCNILSMVTDTYELYCVLNPLVSVSESINLAERLLKIIRKEERTYLTGK